MSAPHVIRARGLGKLYRLGERETYRTLRDALVRALAAPARALGRRREGHRGENADTLWALRDVSFDVAAGEALGVIGRNGAGKSTLLKLLARITEPTEGHADIAGRVASLLEVGSGFHPELTGRENVFLYGTIMGMKRAEIHRKLDEIVAFAEVEKFVDTPVKRYSSGMYMRLAFSVAAHVEPEILVIDEVLAVGDAAFQKKCLGKMDDMAGESGRTVLFVSHNMEAVRRLCPRALWLEQGRLRFAGPTDDCIASYLAAHLNAENRIVFDPPKELPNRLPLCVHSVEVALPDRSTPPVFSASAALRFQIEWEVLGELHKPRIGLILQMPNGTELLTTCDVTCWSETTIAPGRRVSWCLFPGQILNEGRYALELVGDGWSVHDDRRRGHAFLDSRTGPLLRFEVTDDMTSTCKHYGQYGVREVAWPGTLLLNLEWHQQGVPAPAAPTER